MNRTIPINDALAKTAAKNLIHNLPLGEFDVLIQPHKETRTPSQNGLMWASALSDITEQGWLEGKQFHNKIWHEYFKERFMPEKNDPELSLLVKDVATYVKWADTPDGDMKCIASTTSLTKKGFSNYIEQVYAFGAKLGVMFTAVQR